MKKRTVLFLIVLAMTLFVACSPSKPASTQEDTNKTDDASQTKKEKQQEKQKKEKEQKKKAAEKKRQQKPYKAIKPPKDAKPLKDHYSDKEQKHMTTAEAHGDETKRSVELGQTLLDGKEDPTNGPLKDHRLVAFYGTPKSKDMGILGEYSKEDMMKKLKKQTAEYSKIDPDRPAIPTIELIATVAQRTPGPDDTYVTKPNKDTIDDYAKLAKKHHALLLLDVQLGQADVMEEVKKVAPYLKLPYVHLAIDTEYSVQKGETPGVDLGEVDGGDVQKAVEYVDKIVEDNNLPDKIVLVHQFGNGIVKNKEQIKPTKHVQVPLNYDGFGDPNIKMSAYGHLVRNQPIQYGGFKLFYKNDDPLLEPKDVLKLDPAPAVINYQ